MVIAGSADGRQTVCSADSGARLSAFSWLGPVSLYRGAGNSEHKVVASRSQNESREAGEHRMLRPLRGIKRRSMLTEAQGSSTLRSAASPPFRTKCRRRLPVRKLTPCGSVIDFFKSGWPHGRQQRCSGAPRNCWNLAYCQFVLDNFIHPKQTTECKTNQIK